MNNAIDSRTDRNIDLLVGALRSLCAKGDNSKRARAFAVYVAAECIRDII